MATDAQACPSCGKPVSARFRRCGYCGTELAPAQPMGEVRRLVTIVTSDLKGSTALGERLDPESLREVMTTYIDEMTAVFEAHAGTIQKIIGDAIVAVFGLPAARDDDALRAVEAATESQRAMVSLNDRLEERWGVRLTVRTGAATGDVLVGEASAGQHVVTGRTIEVATAMEQNAPPGEVLIAASTLDAVRDLVQVEPAGEVRARGSDDAVAGFRLVAVAERPADAPGAAADAAGRLCAICGTENPEDFVVCGSCGAVLATRRATRDTRKTVTVVFADPKPTTADGSPLDPGALRDVMSRYFASMQTALGRHGATVEKFIGDAVMAVFGLPVRHEDDALRAVRAAADMQAALPPLNAAFEAEWGITLQNHIGVNTGEVVAGDAALGQRLVTGDTVNVAARLEQAAGAREVLLGDLTYRLVRDAVAVEQVEPLTLKGKAEPVPAYRLVSVSDATAGVERRHDAPMVGRERELSSLTDLFGAATDARDCRMATVIGDAGVGKSRLIAEFTAARSADALVIRGRCLPYGEGITFWPLREAARDAAGIGSDDPPEEALLKLSQHVADQAVADRLASVIGLSETPFPVPEVFWAARRFLEDLGRERPVLLVVDDIHWAEATFLELIGHLVESVEESPVVVLCSSRHELLDAHPDWAAGERMVRVILQPLTDADAGRVVEGLLGGTGLADKVRARIVQSAAGNPLYVEQMLSMLIDEGVLRREAGEWVQAGDLTSLRVPPTIEALLAARLDLLEPDGRGVIEPASVVGQHFAQAAVGALVPERLVPEVPEQLDVLARRQLVQPNPSHDSDEVAYRFQHLLVRDAAYGGLLKRSRAELHERFVDWAEGYNEAMGLDNRAFEEIHGYHLEQAYRYLAELGTLDARAAAVGERASVKLASAGRRAMARGDGPAAANLLRRASSTLPVDSAARGSLLPRLAEALLETGEFEAAKDVLVETRRIARLVGDARLRADGVLVRLLIEAVLADQEDWAGVASREVRRAIAVFEQADDHAGLALAYRVLVYLHATPGRYGEAAQAAQQIVEHARIAEDRRLETRGITGYVQAALLGPTPVAEALSVSEQLVEEAAGDRRAEALIRLAMAQLRAMLGDFAEARGLYESARLMLRELGPGVVAASTSIDAAQVEILAGDLAAAEAALLRDEAELEALGEQYVRSTVAGLLARVQALQGRQSEADATAERVRLLAAEDDVDPQIAWRTVRAGVLLGRGELEAARTLIAEAIALSRQADNPRLQAIVLADAGDLARAAGDRAAAESSWAEAVGLYERKGDRTSAAQLRARMQERAGSGDPTRSVSRSGSS